MRFVISLFICAGLAAPAWSSELTGRVEHTAGDIARPPFVTLGAYTNDQMVGQYYSIFKTRNEKPIPPSGQKIKLEKEITRYWSGAGAPSFLVQCRPIPNFPGNFYFSAVNEPYGPRGWLQDLGYSGEKGRVYRYWFDY